MWGGCGGGEGGLTCKTWAPPKIIEAVGVPDGNCGQGNNIPLLAIQAQQLTHWLAAAGARGRPLAIAVGRVDCICSEAGQRRKRGWQCGAQEAPNCDCVCQEARCEQAHSRTGDFSLNNTLQLPMSEIVAG